MYLEINGDLFEVVKPDTKKGQGLRDTYNYYLNRYGTRSIYQAYKTPSRRKVAIYEQWVRDFNVIGCERITVMGASSSFFSVAASCASGLFYITPSHNYFVPDCISTYQAIKGGRKI